VHRHLERRAWALAAPYAPPAPPAAAPPTWPGVGYPPPPIRYLLSA
jgi:hypothetical protein